MQIVIMSVLNSVWLLKDCGNHWRISKVLIFCVDYKKDTIWVFDKQFLHFVDIFYILLIERKHTNIRNFKR